jgi:hypothetical protein
MTSRERYAVIETWKLLKEAGVRSKEEGGEDVLRLAALMLGTIFDRKVTIDEMVAMLDEILDGEGKINRQRAQ